MITGSQFSINAALPGRQVQRIRIEILPGGLKNSADSFGEGWFDRDSRELRLQYHQLILFGTAKIDRFFISGGHEPEQFELSVIAQASPGIEREYPKLAWSKLSRFLIDEKVKLPEWAVTADKVELFAEIAGKEQRIANIYLGNAVERAGSQNSLPMAGIHNMGVQSSPGRASQTLMSRVVDRIKSMDRIFLAVVVLPTLISTLYFGLIASDVYISESTFVVRGTQQQMLSPLSMVLGATSFGASQDDGYSVQGYITSRDALRALDEKMSLRDAFSSSKVDVFDRFAGLDWWDDSFEGLYKYYLKKVDVQIDSSTSLLTLDTRAFTAEDSYKMNKLLLDLSETMVNQLNERGRQDLINFAAREVATAEKNDREATMALSRMQTEGFGPSRGSHSLASKFTDYQRVVLEKDIADKMLSTALGSLEEARNEALRKQLYIERIAEPGKPDKAMEPRRLRNVIETFLLGLVAWGVLTMLVAGIREHRD